MNLTVILNNGGEMVVKTASIGDHGVLAVVDMQDVARKLSPHFWAQLVQEGTYDVTDSVH